MIKVHAPSLKPKQASEKKKGRYFRSSQSICPLCLTPFFVKLLSLSYFHSHGQDGCIQEDMIGSELWIGLTSMSSHPVPMIEIADGNGVARPENCKEASLEALVPLATVMEASRI